MKTIAYYISDYGYGHASRSIAIIRKLLIDPNIRIIICHSYAISFLKDSIQSNRVSYREVKTDIGYFLEKDSLEPDRVKLLVEYNQYILSWNYQVSKEEKFLRFHEVTHVISDISPIPFLAAENLGIPSIGISNFTWYTAYQGLLTEEQLRPFKEAYQKMTYFLALAGCQESWGIHTRQYGFFSREADLQEVKRISQFVNPTGSKRIVFLGLGMKIDIPAMEFLEIWESPDVVFIVSSNVPVIKDHVYQIPAAYSETQNYIAASDLVISKAGWGTVGEAINTGIPLLILERDSMKEDQNTIKYLKKFQLCETMSWSDFQEYKVKDTLIDQLKESVSMYRKTFKNPLDEITEEINRILYPI